METSLHSRRSVSPISEKSQLSEHTADSTGSTGSLRARAFADQESELRATAPIQQISLSQVSTTREVIEQFHQAIIQRHAIQEGRNSPMPVSLMLKPLEHYTPSEIVSFITDFDQLRLNVDQAPSTGKAKICIGSPASGKSSLIESLKHTEDFASLDFDTVALPALSQYQKMKKHTGKAQSSYEKFRGASQVIHNCLLAYTIEQQKDFGLAITGTSPFFSNTMSFLSQRGYQVEINHMTCPHQTRVQSNDLRNKAGKYQCTSELESTTFY